MTRSTWLGLTLLLSPPAAFAQDTQPHPEGDTGSSQNAAPPPAADAPPPAPAPAPAPTVTPEDLERLRQDIKTELREEMRAEIEKAAREAAQERRAAQEWEEESWVEEIRPKLNFVDFDG